MLPLEIDIRNDQTALAISVPRIRKAIRTALKQEGVASAVLSVTIADDPTIHRLNREYLQHDYPTDVISFQLDFQPEEDAAHPGQPRGYGAAIEGEIIVSADTAIRIAAEINWPALDELTLYVIHGLLHICGYDDLTPDEKVIMRSRERKVLSELGLTPCYPADEESH